MSEYYQLTIQDYMDLKKSIGEELIGVKKSFVRIGYALRKIADEKLYEQDGYGSVTEFAEREYGLSKSTTSRFMAINARYSVNGYSTDLLPEYAGYGQSKLVEMLSLPEEDMPMLTPAAPRETIRNLKEFNAMPEPEDDGGLSDFLREFFRNRREELDAIYGQHMKPSEITELLCPSGNGSFRKGKYLMVLYETKVVIKEFAKPPVEFTWPDISERIFGLFEDHGGKTWEMRFGEPEKEEKPAPPPEKPQVEAPKRAPEPAKNKEKSRVAPAQLRPKKEEEAEDELEEDEEEISEEGGGDRGGDVQTGYMDGIPQQESDVRQSGTAFPDIGLEADLQDNRGENSDSVSELDHDEGSEKEHESDDGQVRSFDQEGSDQEYPGVGGIVSEEVKNAACVLAAWMRMYPSCYVTGNKGKITLYRMSNGEAIKLFVREER